jgi:hypothetical protein
MVHLSLLQVIVIVRRRTCIHGGAGEYYAHPPK